MLAPRLSRVLLLVRGSEGLASAVHFYQAAVGLPVLRMTDEWAELDIGLTGQNNVTLTLKAVSNESQLSTGYAPWMSFTVPNMDETVAACVQAGAHLDGPIQYPAHGKVAVLRTPQNHMMGLYEPTAATAVTFEQQEKEEEK